MASLWEGSRSPILALQLKHLQEAINKTEKNIPEQYRYLSGDILKHCH